VRQPGQGDRSELVVHAVGVEHAAMSARFIPLSDDGIDPGCGDDLRLVEIRRRREEDNPSVAESLDAITRGQAEVRADDRRAFDTAAAISGVDTPAIGAWRIGDSGGRPQ
jgi:hypothetical protein